MTEIRFYGEGLAGFERKKALPGKLIVLEGTDGVPARRGAVGGLVLQRYEDCCRGPVARMRGSGWTRPEGPVSS